MSEYLSYQPPEAQDDRTREWETMVARVREVLDVNGAEVDEKIFDAVVALNVHGFTTTGSCEGHLDHGEPATWVDVGDNPPAELEQQVTAYMEQHGERSVTRDELVRSVPGIADVRERNAMQMQRLQEKLDQFNGSRPDDTFGQLTLEDDNLYGQRRLTQRMLEGAANKSDEEHRQELERRQKEMMEFGTRLKNSFIRNE